VTELGQLPPVAGRATELSQVFLNLLVNAAHAIPQGNPQQQRVTVATRTENGRCYASITDTGCGIPQEVLPRIFDAFFTTKPEGVGTGLGLAITRDIVVRAGGNIRVESAPGKGTTFTVDLPALS
jgi:signal transduction histidine kinase